MNVIGLITEKTRMTRGPRPLCGSGLARDPAFIATRRLIAGQPAPTKQSETG